MNTSKHIFETKEKVLIRNQVFEELESEVDSFARFSPKTRDVPDLQGRIRHIKLYVENHSYAPKPFEHRLLPVEAKRLTEIRSYLQQLRTDLESLIEAYRQRTGEA